MFQARLRKFCECKSPFQALQKTGVNFKLMVRAAGPPAVMYGCETNGVSDTALAHARATIVAAAAPQAGGKNPDLTLLILDGIDGTLDLAFDGHIGPIKY